MNQFEPIDFGNFKNWNFLKTVPENAIRKVWPTIVLRQRYRIKYGRPAPVGLNTINLLQNKRYPKRVLTMRMGMAGFGKPKNVTNFSGRIQQKGTCWFQTIVNGWLLSKIGRKVIKERLTAFKKSSNVRALTKNQFNACPSRKHIPQAYFWSYIEHMLNTKEWNTAFRLNVLRGVQFPEGKLIRSSGLRSPNKSIVGGSERDIFTFNDILFGGQQDYFVFSKKLENPRVPIPEKKAEGVLSHAYIVYGNHAIAGYIGLNGNPMIYDSNRVKPMFLDWVRRPRSVISYFKAFYPQPASTVLNVTVTYLRHYNPSNAPSPETRKLNKSIFNVKKIYRYNKNNYIRFFKNIYNIQNFLNKNNNYQRISNPVTMNNVKNIISYVAYKNTLMNRPALRRRYRLKFGKHAPGNMSNENIKKVL